MTFDELSRLYRLVITTPHQQKNHYLLQYSLLVDNSPLGPDCPYAARARALHYETQIDEVVTHLRDLRGLIDQVLEEVETHDPDSERQLSFPFMVH